MDTKKIQNLIRFISQSNVSEVSLELEGLKIKVRNTSKNAIQEEVIEQTFTNTELVHQNNNTQTKISANHQEEKFQENDNLVTVLSPMIGTVYHRPSPDKPVFCQVGDVIKQGDTLCIIEAMKLFNEVESEVFGKIVKILINDATPVEFDQPLFLIEPM